MAVRRVAPGGPLRGSVDVPGDKSQSHRTLMLGALADGPSRVQNGLRSGDIACLARAMRACGVGVDDRGAEWRIEPPHALAEPSDVLDLGNSGTSLRLLTGLFAGRPGDRQCVLTGDDSLRERPMARVIEPLRRMGAEVGARQRDRLAPVVVRGRELQRVHHDLPIASAQVKSSLLLAGLGTGVSLTQPGESRDHTERMLASMGARLQSDGRRVTLEPTERLTAFDWTVAGDVSSAAFWLVAGSLVPGSEIVLRNVGLNPTRTGVIDALRAMGADLEIERTHEAPEPRGDIVVRHAPLRGTTIAGELALRAIDEVPGLAVAAAFASGETTFSDLAELRVKESDRLARVGEGLEAMGFAIEARSDGFVVEGRPESHRGASFARIDARGDHRIAMAFAVAGSVRGGVELVGAEEVASSYPRFFDDLERLRGDG